MDVVSLFNGMGTLRQAMHNLNIKVDRYYSSEIKPAAIELQQFHFPDVIQVGDINNWREWDIDWSKVGFIGSGSPCQDLSIAGKRKGVIDGSRSNLFFVFIEILDHVRKLNPNVLFLQENVGSADINDVGIMSRALGVYPVRLNSNRVVAQNRDRYYWTNIKTKAFGMFGDIVVDIPEPKDRKIMLNDILTDGFSDRDKAQTLLHSEAKTYGYKDMKKFNILISKRRKEGRQLPNLVYMVDNEVRVKTNTMKGYDTLTENDVLNLSFPTSTTRRGRITKGKVPCLLEGNEPLFVLKNSEVRMLNKIELCRAQGFPDNYCDSITRNKAASLLGDGWTLPIIEHILSFMQLV